MKHFIIVKFHDSTNVSALYEPINLIIPNYTKYGNLHMESILQTRSYLIVTEGNL